MAWQRRSRQATRWPSGSWRRETGSAEAAKLNLRTLSIWAVLAGLFASGAMAQAPRTRAPVLSALTDQQINHLLGPPGGHVISVRAFPGAPPETLIQGSLNGRPPGAAVSLGPCGGSGPGLRVGPEPTPAQRIYEDLSSTDLAVVGKVGAAKSYALPDGGFLYSILPFRVEQVIKNNPAAPISPGDTITIGRDGGELEIAGHLVTAYCQNDPPYIPGVTYFLSLRYVPSAAIYITHGGLILANGQVQRLGPRFPHHPARWYDGMSARRFLVTEREQAQRIEDGQGPPHE